MNAQTAWRRLDAELDGLVLVHEMRAGDAPLLLVHGVGPGTTGRLNFGSVLESLSPRFALHLVDLAGFGGSDRLPSPPFFDPGFWLRQLGQAIDRIIEIHGRAPMLIGNSVGGALVLKAAAMRSEVRAVLSIAPAAAPPAPAVLRAFWTAPADEAALARALRPMTGAVAPPDPAVVRARFAAFRDVAAGRYFNAMLADPDACLSAAALTPEEAGRIDAEVAVLHGRQDRACPAAALMARLAPLLPQADVMLLAGCGHNLIAERRAEVIAAIETLARKVDHS